MLWSQRDPDDTASDCMVNVPSHGNFGKYYLRKLESGAFVMIGRAWEQDPLTKDENEHSD